MFELLSKFHPDELIGLTAVVGGLICGVVGIVMGVGLAIRKTELAAGLKKSMLERGMSAEEIRMVMDSGSCSSLEHGKQKSKDTKFKEKEVAGGASRQPILN
jgi:hypothetical protein